MPSTLRQHRILLEPIPRRETACALLSLGGSSGRSEGGGLLVLGRDVGVVEELLAELGDSEFGGELGALLGGAEVELSRPHH